MIKLGFFSLTKIVGIPYPRITSSITCVNQLEHQRSLPVDTSFVCFKAHDLWGNLNTGTYIYQQILITSSSRANLAMYMHCILTSVT